MKKSISEVKKIEKEILVLKQNIKQLKEKIKGAQDVEKKSVKDTQSLKLIFD